MLFTAYNLTKELLEGFDSLPAQRDYFLLDLADFDLGLVACELLFLALGAHLLHLLSLQFGIGGRRGRAAGVF